MVLRLGVGGRKQDKAFNMPFVSFNMLSTKNFGSVDLINKEFIISHSKKSKYKTVPGLIDLAAHCHHKDSGSFPFFVQLSSAESLQPQANGNQFLGALFLSQWPDIDWKLFLHFINVFNFSQKHSRRFPLISLARIVSDPLPTAITSKRKEATVIALDWWLSHETTNTHLIITPSYISPPTPAHKGDLEIFGSIFIHHGDGRWFRQWRSGMLNALQCMK